MIFQVDVFRSGLRDTVPSTPDGGALQEVLQHVWIPRGLHRRVAGAVIWW